MKDVRLLTLYKQHYLDTYVEPLDTKISCLGYYDGISIDQVQENKNEMIAVKKSKLPISELWYSTGKKIENLDGGKSNQHIGLFRCIKQGSNQEAAKGYWDEEKSLPFFLVAFLKLREDRKYDEIGREIETSYDRRGDRSKNKVCRIMTYCTYDNADLVVLMKSNCFVTLKETIQKIESDEEIVYLHSITGIEEAYLTACKELETILYNWNGTACFVKENLAQINLRLATSGTSDDLKMIKYELHKWSNQNHNKGLETDKGRELIIKNYEHIQYAYMMGHTNMNMIIPDTDVATLLVLLLSGSFLTHQNDVYKNGLYNIETSIIVQLRDWNEIEEKSVKEYNPNSDQGEEQSNSFNWCRRTINNCKIIFDDEIKSNDESLYSYYQSLLQTLNALDQYERFGMSRDIFRLIVPSFVMFEKKLRSVIEKKNYDQFNTVKSAMCEYLECVNSIMYHTIHTDQVYLMIPGYSGTSFSIPLKLNLFYLWFAQKVTELLNDNDRIFSCILAPVMESKPETGIIKVLPVDSNRLIWIKLSQRSLFLPRNLMIILLHEFGHYVGKEIRCRKERMESLIKTMAYFLVEGILAENYQQNIYYVNNKTVINMLKKQMHNNLTKSVVDAINEAWKHCEWDPEYHAIKIRQPLINLCLKTISDGGSGARVVRTLHEIPQEVLEQIQVEIEKLDEKDKKAAYVEIMRDIYKYQQYWEKNRVRLLSSNVINELVKKLIRTYQEVFSDMAAITILDCNQEDFKEAFRVSEGVSYEIINEPNIHLLRKQIANEIIFQTASDETDKKQNPDKEKYNPQLLVKNFYTYKWVNYYLIQYAEKCYKKINERIKSQEYYKIVEDLRSVFNLFRSDGCECNEIYSTIIACINEYREYVQEILTQDESDYKKQRAKP